MLDIGKPLGSDRLGSSARQTTSFSRQEFFGPSVEMVDFAFVSAILVLRIKNDTNLFGGFRATIGDSRGLCVSPLPANLLVPILIRSFRSVSECAVHEGPILDSPNTNRPEH